MTTKTPEQLAEEFAIENWLYQNGAQPTDISRDSFEAGFKAAKEQERWISVSKSLPQHSPDKTHLVLVWVTNGYGNGHAETSMLYPDGKWSHIRSEETVTHWKPLPQPPTKEAND